MSLGLNLENAQEQGTTIPDGTYEVILNKAEVTPTKSGGTMIKVQYKVTGPTQVGRVIFDQFNIENANPQAVQIGLGQLKGLLKSFGHKNPNRLETTDELLGLKGQVTVKTVDDGGAYGPQVRVRGYKALAATGQITNGTLASGSTTTANPFG
jgi:hypothetical protein